MSFSSIFSRNTRLVTVLRNHFALLVSVDVIYFQHARKSYLTSTETRTGLAGTRHVLPVIFEMLQ